MRLSLSEITIKCDLEKDDKFAVVTIPVPQMSAQSHLHPDLVVDTSVVIKLFPLLI